ncbi:MAG: hypothetical protein JWQ70_1622 [Aeromicrobium sp.]|nr:hypothetical protein [Aeromicrobium sp.]
MSNRIPTRRARAVVAALALTLTLSTAAACSGGDSSGEDQKRTQLIGLVRLTPGAAKGSTLTGTWFRMIQVGGSVKNGPYMTNANSKADGGKATLLQPGSSGGLRLAGYQSQPKQPFDAKGNSLAKAITKPTPFFGVAFSLGTNPVDPQTKTKVAPPTVYVKDGKLTADLSSWGVTWNNQVFNQGAPKPVSNTGAKAPGQAKAEKVWDWVSGTYLESAPPATISGKGATGTYDAKTGRFVLEWTSLIEGGPFNRFTGQWHLEGTFEKDGRAPSGSN